jgi:hypothetical protein
MQAQKMSILNSDLISISPLMSNCIAPKVLQYLIIGFFSLPQITKGASPKAQGHKFSHSKNIGLAVGAHFIPGLFLDMTLFNRKIVGLGVVMDSSVGVIVSTEKPLKCPSKAISVSMYTEHEIRAEFLKKQWPIVSTGRVPIMDLTPCPQNQAKSLLSRLSSRSV